MAEQVVDLLHQRLQFHRRLLVQLLALPLLQLGDLLSGALQRAQRQAHGVALQQQQGEQGEAHQAQTAQPHAGEAVENRCVVLRHADDDRLAVAAVFRAVGQQALLLRAIQQVLGQARALRPLRRGVPQRA